MASDAKGRGEKRRAFPALSARRAEHVPIATGQAGPRFGCSQCRVAPFPSRTLWRPLATSPIEGGTCLKGGCRGKAGGGGQLMGRGCLYRAWSAGDTREEKPDGNSARPVITEPPPIIADVRNARHGPSEDSPEFSLVSFEHCPGQTIGSPRSVVVE